ncbi:hypothetical protein OSB04_014660 [Centaurea solstitialis]|uniref:NB-ARC domain-containing protein n=1 Tax=Centaurea solstitialis TaxID=347529 RepID=A0AA38T9G9_9ASTR|nr:hypothetical protein OSB04_014660 [Centaurea solstitialis]
MAYTGGGLQMFMGYLKQIINCNHVHIPFINNNPMILSEMPKFQLLYQELDSIIQTLSNIHQHHHHHELEKVRNLKKRFRDAAEEAQDTIDLFLSDATVDFTNSGVFLDLMMSQGRPSRIDFCLLVNSQSMMTLDLMTWYPLWILRRIAHVKTQSAAAAAAETSYTRNPLGIKKPSEEIVVGLHHDVEIIRDKLTEDAKQLCVVSIVGMGGVGKTTLANELFNDRFLKYHFHIRAWATVSQSYVRRDLLIQILVSIGAQQGLDQANDSQLREKLHKSLMGRRYLIVIDDVWSIEAWDDLKVFFPHDNTASRILLTSRQNEVALHVKPHGFVYSLPCLTEEESWELLKQKVFHGDECPKWLIEPGRQIAKECHGLPLSVVVMAGVLAKEPMNKDLWEEIACSVSSYIVSDHKGCLDTLALSYHHLPNHLKECFLYLGGFPEDFRFNVTRVIWLWVAEGFIEEAGNQSLEDTGKAYLMDLINRNLVIVTKRDEIGDVKACKLHDLVRELCLQKANEEGLFLKIDSPTSSSQLPEGITYKKRRVFMNKNVNNFHVPHSLTRTMRSLLCYHLDTYLLNPIAHSFVLLRVLDLQECEFGDFPRGLALLVHLRYLAICCSSEFPKSICKLWSLQTLILRTPSYMHLPRNITDLVNLRHLWSNNVLCLPYIEKPMNLHSISMVMLEDGVDNFQKCFPNIKKLALCRAKDVKYHFELLPYLENWKLIGPSLQQDHIVFPPTLKKLSLIGFSLPWSDMSIIQLLPNLEVLRLHSNLFTPGREWDACEQQFRQLKLLKLEWLDIKHWKATSTSFPCLRRLTLRYCEDLEEIPLEIGEIATLELIEIKDCSNSVVESAQRIQQEQNEVGNDELKIIVHRSGVILQFKLAIFSLETLKLMGPFLRWIQISFSTTLEKLRLEGCLLPWSDMSIVQLLPNLNILKLKDNFGYLCVPYIENPMDLHSISKVMFKDGAGNLKNCFPNIKKLVLLPYLENKLMGSGLQWEHIVLPATLKKLSLINCKVPWSYMSIIQFLPNLEVLKLKNGFFTGVRQWDASEQQFRQLKLLKLKHLDIKQWAASSTSFPCLKQLSVSWCKDLEEIPLEIGEIPTLELIKVDGCSKSVVESVKRIQQEQHDVGNYELKITVHGKELSLSLSQHVSSESE